ncbi:MAG: hypothetical protein R3C28_19845 [Pirellulaceae bacterium]
MSSLIKRYAFLFRLFVHAIRDVQLPQSIVAQRIHRRQRRRYAMWWLQQPIAKNRWINTGRAVCRRFRQWCPRWLWLSAANSVIGMLVVGYAVVFLMALCVPSLIAFARPLPNDQIDFASDAPGSLQRLAAFLGALTVGLWATMPRRKRFWSNRQNSLVMARRLMLISSISNRSSLDRIRALECQIGSAAVAIWATMAWALFSEPYGWLATLFAALICLANAILVRRVARRLATWQPVGSLETLIRVVAAVVVIAVCGALLLPGSTASVICSYASYPVWWQFKPLLDVAQGRLAALPWTIATVAVPSVCSAMLGRESFSRRRRLIQAGRPLASDHDGRAELGTTRTDTGQTAVLKTLRRERHTLFAWRTWLFPNELARITDLAVLVSGGLVATQAVLAWAASLVAESSDCDPNANVVMDMVYLPMVLAWLALEVIALTALEAWPLHQRPISRWRYWREIQTLGLIRLPRQLLAAALMLSVTRLWHAGWPSIWFVPMMIGVTVQLRTFRSLWPVDPCERSMVGGWHKLQGHAWADAWCLATFQIAISLLTVVAVAMLLVLNHGERTSWPCLIIGIVVLSGLALVEFRSRILPETVANLAEKRQKV